MRSFVQKFALIAALAAPLAAFAAGGSSAPKSPVDDSNPCGLPCCGPTGQRAQGSAGDKLADLGGQNGIANSYDSP